MTCASLVGGTAQAQLPSMEPTVAELVSHEVRATLTEDLVDVRTTLRFQNLGDVARTVRHQFPVSVNAAIAEFEVCHRNGASVSQCRTASQLPSSLGPERDGPRGRANVTGRSGAFISVSAEAPPQTEVEVRIRYVAPLHIAGSTVRWEVPADDNRRIGLVPISLSVDGDPNMRVLDNPGARLRFRGVHDPGSPLTVTGQLSGPQRVTAVNFACGRQTCSRVFGFGGASRPRQVQAVWLWDRSASMRSVPDQTKDLTFSMLLNLLPAGSRVRMFGFSDRVEELTSGPTVSNALARPGLSRDSFTGEISRPTRFDRAWDALKLQGTLPTDILWVGDGEVTPGPNARRAFLEARRTGVRIHHLNQADRYPSLALVLDVESTGGRVVNLTWGVQGEHATALASLPERLGFLVEPASRSAIRLKTGDLTERLGGAIRRGDVVQWTGELSGELRIDGRPPPQHRVGTAIRRALSSMTTRWPAAWVTRGIPASHPYRVQAPRVFTDGGVRIQGSVSREVVQRMFQRQIRPRALGCIARDHRGQPGHAVSAVLTLAFRDGETERRNVFGSISPTLRTCLLETLNDIQLPVSRSPIVARFNIQSERETRDVPEAHELGEELGAAIDRLAPPFDDSDYGI